MMNSYEKLMDNIKESSYLIKTNGDLVKVSPENRKDFSLKELQGYVNGYIEIVYLRDNIIMVVNEEGKLKGLPFNKNATVIFSDGRPISDLIVGDALICNRKLVK